MTLHITFKLEEIARSQHTKLAQQCLECPEDTDIHIFNLVKQTEDTLALIVLEEFNTLVS